jgi:type II secretory pathway pseudopilin PulG
VLELLLAVSLSALVGLAAVRLLAGSRASEVSTSTASDRARALDLAADLLTGELRRAGYVPYPSPLADGRGAVRPGLTVTLGSGPRGDALGLRYLDDRLQGGPVTRDLEFDAAIDGRGLAQLYRTTASGSRQPWVQGIDRIQVVGWVDSTGLHNRSELAAGELRPWLVLLALGAAGAPVRRLAVPLPSRPLATVVEGS